MANRGFEILLSTSFLIYMKFESVSENCRMPMALSPTYPLWIRPGQKPQLLDAFRSGKSNFRRFR